MVRYQLIDKKMIVSRTATLTYRAAAIFRPGVLFRLDDVSDIRCPAGHRACAPTSGIPWRALLRYYHDRDGSISHWFRQLTSFETNFLVLHADNPFLRTSFVLVRGLLEFGRG